MKPGVVISSFLLLITVFFVQTAASAPVFTDTIKLENRQLQLNGTGTRTKFFLSLYDAGLYLQEKSSNASEVVAADMPMAIRMHITSSMITSEKMEDATMEGFVRSTGGKTQPLEEEIDQFIAVFRKEIKEGDIYDMIYLPGTGVSVLKNGSQAAVISGLPFKQALFGIWLSPDPVQESLKEDLLGKE